MQCKVVHPRWGACVVSGKHGGPDSPHRYEGVASEMTETHIHDTDSVETGWCSGCLAGLPVEDLSEAQLLAALEAMILPPRRIRKGDRVRIVKPLSLDISGVGAVGKVFKVTEGWADIRTLDGTWYCVEVEKLELA